MKLRGKENFTWDNLKSKKVKTYSDFCEIGLTHSGKKGMAGKRGLVHFIHYNIGVRLAYLAWILGLSANTFTFIRLLMTLTGFLLIFDSSYITKYIYFFSYPDIFYRLFGVSLIFVQKAMDGGDGALSRVNQSSSPNGREADVMVDFGSKIVTPFFIKFSQTS